MPTHVQSTWGEKSEHQCPRAGVPESLGALQAHPDPTVLSLNYEAASIPPVSEVPKATGTNSII